MGVFIDLHRPALFVVQILDHKQSRCSQPGTFALCSSLIKEKDGKTFINVYGPDGQLIDVMEEVASYIPPRKDEDKNKIAK